MIAALGPKLPGLIVGGAFLLLGVRSLLRWLARDYAAESPLERVVFTLHVTARVGMWFVLGAFFVGLEVVDEPQRLTWFALVPIGLASVQLLSGFWLSRLPPPPAGGEEPPGA